ncbi:MAG: hypothetical protein N2692_00455 [Patescibacteria group bacterium]|nr:hypothetical protein [Patescibacteria group bacterium]
MASKKTLKFKLEESDKILTTGESIKNLSEAKAEYLLQYKKYLEMQKSVKKEKKPDARLEAEAKLKEAELWYKNAYNMYRRALDEYKVSEYHDVLNRKKRYIRDEIAKRKRSVIENRLLKAYPSITPAKLQEAVEREIDKEAEIIFEKEKNDIQKLLISEVAFNTLAEEERTAEEIRAMINSVNIKNAKFFGKLWEKYKALPYGKKALIGAAIAGVGGGVIGAAGGAGFAALGIGATAFARRFFGGVVVGGSIKSLADKLIKRKENKVLIEETNKNVEKISKEIADLINDPAKTPQSYEQWINIAEELDSRLDQVLAERDKIRAQHDKKRRKWTLIAALIGGVAANADNIYALTKRAFGHDVLLPEPPSKPVEQVITKIEKLPKPSTRIFEMIGERNVFPTIYVGKGGFWAAAQTIKQQLGMTDEFFARAWSNAEVIDPISGQVFKMPQAHWVLPLKSDQQVLLTLNPEDFKFQALITPKVKIGGAEDLINAYKKLGKEVPLGVIKSILRGLGQN